MASLRRLPISLHLSHSCRNDVVVDAKLAQILDELCQTLLAFQPLQIDAYF